MQGPNDTDPGSPANPHAEDSRRRPEPATAHSSLLRRPPNPAAHHQQQAAPERHGCATRASSKADQRQTRLTPRAARRPLPGGWAGILRPRQRELQERLARRRLAPGRAPHERDRPRQRLGPDRAQLDRRPGLARRPSAACTATPRPLRASARTAPISVQMNALRGSSPRVGHRALQAPPQRGVLAVGDRGPRRRAARR